MRSALLLSCADCVHEMFGLLAQAIVRVPRWFRHRKVDVDVKRSSKHWAHDEFNLCSVGDLVRIEPFRALSKRKAHVVVEILKKEDGSPPPSPFPSF